LANAIALSSIRSTRITMVLLVATILAVGAPLLITLSLCPWPGTWLIPQRFLSPAPCSSWGLVWCPWRFMGGGSRSAGVDQKSRGSDKV